MRTCKYCGADIPDGEFYCPVCDKPVQLVPDYETIESRTREMELKQQEEARIREEEAQRRREEAERRRQEELQRRQQRKQKLMLTLFALIAAALVILTVVVLRIQRQRNSFDYQYRLAAEAYESGAWSDALTHVNQALSLKPDDPDAGYLLGCIYEKSGDVKKAIASYEKVIAKTPDYEKAYDSLIPLYLSEESCDSLQQLLESAPEKIRTAYADYLIYPVTASAEPGIFHEKLSLELNADGNGSIYYTLDGTEPTAASARYQNPIPLSEGETLIRARYISPKQIPGAEFSGSYTVQLEKPPAPVITPRSGTYSSSETTKITVEVPYGYTAYYAFDIRATKNNNRYTGPVDMREGDHIFYAVLVDDNGKEGDVASATYVYTKLTPTPAPTPRPQNARSVITPTSEPTPTPTKEAEKTPTPTPTPTAEPTVEPTPEPTSVPEPTETPSPSGEETENAE